MKNGLLGGYPRAGIQNRGMMEWGISRWSIRWWSDGARGERFLGGDIEPELIVDDRRGIQIGPAIDILVEIRGLLTDHP